MSDCLVVQGAAERCGLSREYLDYLRTADAKVRGLSGPPHKIVYTRIVYPIDTLDDWNDNRLAKKTSR